MGFDLEKLMNTKYSPRENVIELKDLAEFFPKTERAVFKVRGLEGEEIARISDYVEKYKGIPRVIEGLLSQNQSEKIRALKETFGLGDKLPDDFVKRIQYLKTGSVDPVFSQEMAVKFAKAYPIEFYQLTNEILRLTGLGALPGESNPSIEEKM